MRVRFLFFKPNLVRERPITNWKDRQCEQGQRCTSVTQKHKQKREGNGTPVCPKPGTPTTRSGLNRQSPWKHSSSDKELVPDVNKCSPILHNTSSQSASDKLIQSAQEHSGGSNESRTVTFTGPPMSPPGKNTLGCSVSLVEQQCRVETAIKNVEEAVDLKANGNMLCELQVKQDSHDEKPVRETIREVGRVSKFHQGEINTFSKTPVKESVRVLLDVELENRKCGLKIAECKIPDPSENLPEKLPVTLHHSFPTVILEKKINAEDKTQVLDANISEEEKKDLIDAPKTMANVMSMSVLLGSQMVCTELATVPPISTVPISEVFISTPPVQDLNTDHQPRSSPLRGRQEMRKQSPELRIDETSYRQEPEKSTSKRLADMCNAFVSASNAEQTFTSSQKECPESSAFRFMTEASPKAFVIPPISIIDMDGTLETSNSPGCIVTDIGNVLETQCEPRLDHNAYISPDRNNEGKQESSLAAPGQKPPEMTVSATSVTVAAVKQQKRTNAIKETNSSHSLPPVFSSQHGRDRRCASPLSGHSEECCPHSSATENQLFPTKKAGFTTNPATPTLQFVRDEPPEPRVDSSQSEEHKRYAPQTVRQPPTLSDTRGSLNETQGSVPVSNIQSDNNTSPSEEVKVEEYSEPASSSCVSDTKDNTGLLKTDSVSLIQSATSQELASGARRKITKLPGDNPEAAAPPTDTQSPDTVEVSLLTSRLTAESPSAKSSCLSPKFPPRQTQSGHLTSPAETHYPLHVRRQLAQNPETRETTNTAKTEEKLAEKDMPKRNPFKAPQVIRKIRGEPFLDAAGHLKLWCQFFNVLSDSTVRWFRNQVEIAEVKRSAGDETQVALAIVHTSSIDCGLYGCTITNEYGTDTTDFLLSVDVLSGMLLRGDREVGEEIEMTPLLFTKGLADSGIWGSKFFGRIMMEEAQIGEGCSHKACKVKVIYGLEPVFESGGSCYIKVKSPIAYYEDKKESNLVEKNQAVTLQECRIQNMAREYCKIFAAECRVIETFGAALEVIPVYLIYRPANTIPHATVEADLNGVYVWYCQVDASDRLVMRTCSEAALKCCALQHWIHQWTNGNLLLTRMEGVDLKITNVSISIKSKGYQGLTITENPGVFEQFVSQHQCNYYCGLLSLRQLKSQDSLQTTAKPKGSRSPLVHRKMTGSSSPQPTRKATGSPRLTRKVAEPEESKSTADLKSVDFLTVVQV
ncbi:hypothetical protein DPEC_G00253670 [Dallia pectoralis]|uniref:Uncharacterized protein n=1 Tax=Dallia pectoralis TaxID=75939 RepID=A0ACC2FTZ5_DALPE|nr:hypothetical protein DPEC_G00253670 [Dallia pectoralis]